MSKMIDLTGLSRAITKIKAWVKQILPCSVTEVYIKNYTTAQVARIFGSWDIKTSEPITISLYFQGNYQKDITLGIEGEFVDSFVESYDGQTITVRIQRSYNILNYEFVVNDFDSPADWMWRVEEGDYIKVYIPEKRLPEICLPDTIARKSDLYNAISTTLNTEV